eukprot:SAG11_NODE_18666_length_484_cov_0.992208_1_plen_53_part_01
MHPNWYLSIGALVKQDTHLGNVNLRLGVLVVRLPFENMGCCVSRLALVFPAPP